MSTQRLTPEVERWILDQAAAGFSHQQLLESMRASGWDYEVAVRAIAELLCPAVPQPLGAPAVLAAYAAESANDQPGPRLDGAPSLIDAGDRAVRVAMTLGSPRVVLFEGLLAAQECAELIELARPRLEHSRTVDRDSGGSTVHEARTSSGMFFGRGENALCARIERRIERLLNWPVERGEGLQVLRYTPGAEYKPHYDFFDSAQPDIEQILQQGGQRVGTLIMYLHTTPRGGATIFPQAGLEVAPLAGNAVFFGYPVPDPSTRTLHGGTPVLEGEKWIATKWLRERDYG